MQGDMKSIYQGFHDEMVQKRYNSEFPVRRAVHRDIFESVLQFIEKDQTVLDAGCGEGMLSLLMAKKGAHVTGVDLSAANVESAKRLASKETTPVNLTFTAGDSENLPFEDQSFDCVVSNHVLEHLPSFERGLREIFRVTRKHAVIAVPTCLHPSSWALLGGVPYYALSKRALLALPWGALRVLGALISDAEGVDEAYVGNIDLPHRHRFPWKVAQKIRSAGFKILDTQAQSLRLPYLPPSKNGNTLSRKLRYFGIGTVYWVERPSP